MVSAVLPSPFLKAFHTRPSPVGYLTSQEMSGWGCQVCHWVLVAFVAAGETQPTSSREMETEHSQGINRCLENATFVQPSAA